MTNFRSSVATEKCIIVLQKELDYRKEIKCKCASCNFRHLENNKNNIRPKMREATLVDPTIAGDHYDWTEKTQMSF